MAIIHFLAPNAKLTTYKPYTSHLLMQIAQAGAAIAITPSTLKITSTEHTALLPQNSAIPPAASHLKQRTCCIAIKVALIRLFFATGILLPYYASTDNDKMDMNPDLRFGCFCAAAIGVLLFVLLAQHNIRLQNHNPTSNRTSHEVPITPLNWCVVRRYG